MKRLREAMSSKRHELWPNNSIFQHDNTPVHKALSVKHFLAQKSIVEIEHTSCSHYVAQNDCFQK
jgi:hypothetical protein